MARPKFIRRNRLPITVCVWVAYLSMVLQGIPVVRANIVADGRTDTDVSGAGSRVDVHTGTVAGKTGLNSFSRFDVNSAQTVNLHFPDGTVNLLNLVDGKGSEIHGVVNALMGGKIGGNLFLANPDGIVVGPTGVMNAGSLNLSTPTRDAVREILKATDGVDPVTGRIIHSVDHGLLNAFLNNTVPITPGGLISVQGQLNAQSDMVIRAGSVDIGPGAELNAGPAGLARQLEYGAVVNMDGSESAGGLVKGQGGKIQLLGINDVKVTGAVVNAPGDDDHPGGSVEMESQSGDVAVTGGSVINVDADGPYGGGLIRANALSGDVLIADSILTALGRGPGSVGGTVELSAGGDVRIEAGALLNVSGEEGAGGGSVNVDAGQDFIFSDSQILVLGSEGAAGGVFDARAGRDIVIDQGAMLSVDGMGEDSDAGTAIFFADFDTYWQAGSLLSARGGITGDGGFIEVSGRETVFWRGGSAALGAVGGEAGTLLIDPAVIDVSLDGNMGEELGGEFGVFQTDGGNLILEADEEILIGENVYLVARHVSGPAPNWLDAASIGDSGNISLFAPKITIGAGAHLLAHATGNHNAGHILLQESARSEALPEIGGSGLADDPSADPSEDAPDAVNRGIFIGSDVLMSAAAQNGDAGNIDMNVFAAGDSHVSARIDIGSGTRILANSAGGTAGDVSLNVQADARGVVWYKEITPETPEFSLENLGQYASETFRNEWTEFWEGNPYAILRPEAVAEILLGENVTIRGNNVTLDAQANAVALFSVLPGNAAGEAFRRAFVGYDEGTDTFFNLADDWSNPLAGLQWGAALGESPLTGSAVAHSLIGVSDETEILADGDVTLAAKSNTVVNFESLGEDNADKAAGMVLALAETVSQVRLGAAAAGEGITIEGENISLSAVTASDVSAGARTLASTDEDEEDENAEPSINEIALALGVNRVESGVFVGRDVSLNAAGSISLEASHQGRLLVGATGEATSDTIISAAIAKAIARHEVDTTMLGSATAESYSQSSEISIAQDSDMDVPGGTFVVSMLTPHDSDDDGEDAPESLAGGAAYASILPLLYGLLRDPAATTAGDEEPDDDTVLSWMSNITIGLNKLDELVDTDFLSGKVQAIGAVSLADVAHHATATVGDHARISVEKAGVERGDLTVSSRVFDRPILISRVELGDLSPPEGDGGEDDPAASTVAADIAFGRWNFDMQARTVIGTADAAPGAGAQLDSDGSILFKADVESPLLASGTDFINALLWNLDFDEDADDPFEVARAGLEEAETRYEQWKEMFEWARDKDIASFIERLSDEGLFGMTWVNSANSPGSTVTLGGGVAVEQFVSAAEVVIGSEVAINQSAPGGGWTAAELDERSVTMSANNQLERLHLVGNWLEDLGDQSEENETPGSSEESDSFAAGVGAALLVALHRPTASVSGGDNLRLHAGRLDVESELKVLTLGGVVASAKDTGDFGLAGSLNFLDSQQVSRAMLSPLGSDITVSKGAYFSAVDNTFAIQLAGTAMRTDDASVGVSAAARTVSRTTEAGLGLAYGVPGLDDADRGTLRALDGSVADVEYEATAENKGNALALVLSGSKPSSSQSDISGSQSKKSNDQGSFGLSVSGAAAIMLHDTLSRALLGDVSLEAIHQVSLDARDSTLQQAVAGAWTHSNASGGSSFSLTGSVAWQDGTSRVLADLERFLAEGLSDVNLLASREGWTLNVAASVGTQSKGEGGGSGTDVAVQGSVVGNFLEYETKVSARDGDLGEIDSFDAAAKDDSMIITVGGAIGVKGGSDGGVGVGVSVAMHEFLQDTAVDLTGLSATAAGPASTFAANAENTGTIFSLAVAGEVQGDVGIGGVFIWNDLRQNATVHANTGASSSLDLGLDGARFSTIELAAANRSAIYSLAGGLGKGKKAGVGLALTNSFIGGRAAVDITNANLFAETIDLNATTSGDMLAVAIGVGVSTEGVAVAGSQAGNFFGGQTEVVVRDSELDASDSIELTAEEDKTSAVLAGAVSVATSSGKAAVGAAIGINTITGSSSANYEEIDGELALAGRANQSWNDDQAGRVLVSVQNSNLSAGEGGITLDAARKGTLYTLTATGAVAAGAKLGVGLSGSYNRIGGVIGVNVAGGSELTSAGDITLGAGDRSGIYSLAGALGVSKSVAVGAAVAYNEIDVSVFSRVQDSTLMAEFGDIDVIASREAQILTIGVGAGGASNVAVSGAATVNRIMGSVESVVTGSTLDAERILVSASEREPDLGTLFNPLADLGIFDDEDVEAEQEAEINEFLQVSIGSFAGALAFSGGVGVGLSAAYNEHSAEVAARVIDSVLTATGPVIGGDAPLQVLADRSTIITTGSVAGTVSGGSAAVSATGSWNEIKGEVIAQISGGSELNAGGITIAAVEAGTINALSGSVAVSSGTAGVGAGFAVNIIDTNVTASVDSAEVIGGSISLAATRSSTINAITAGVGVAGTAGVGLSYSHNIIGGKISALVSNGSLLDGTHVSIRADDVASMFSVSGALAGAGTAAIGAAASYSEINTHTAIEITDSTLLSEDDIEVAAESTGQIASLAASGGAAGTVAVAGAAVITNLQRKIDVLIENSTLTADDSIRISATSISDLGIGDANFGTDDFDYETLSSDPKGSFAGGITISGTASVGGAATVNIFENELGVTLRNSAITANANTGSGITWQDPATGDMRTGTGLFVHAYNGELLSTGAINVAGSGMVGVGLSGSVNVFSSEVDILVDGGSLNAGETATDIADIEILARNFTRQEMLAGAIGIGIGGGGVGGAVGVNLYAKDTSIEIRNAGLDSTRDVLIRGEALDDLLVIGAAAGGGLYFGGAGTIAVNNFDSAVSVSSINNTITAERDIDVEAEGTTTIEQYAGAVAGGAVAVGGTVAVDTFKNSVEAVVDGGSLTSNTGNIGISAILSQELDTVLVSGSGGIGAVSGTVNVLSGGGSAHARTGNNTILTANRGTISLHALNRFDVKTIVGAGAAGGISIGAAIDVLRFEGTATTTVGAGSQLNAFQAINVDARSERKVSSMTVSGSGGIIAGGASISVVSAGNSSADFGEDEWELDDTDLSAVNDITEGTGDIDLLAEMDGGNSAVIGAASSINAAQSGRSDFDVGAPSGTDGALVDIQTGAVLRSGAALDGAVGAGNVNVTSNAHVDVSQYAGAVSVGLGAMGAGVTVANWQDFSRIQLGSAAQLLAPRGSVNVLASAGALGGSRAFRQDAVGATAGGLGLDAMVAHLNLDRTVTALVGANADLNARNSAIVRASESGRAELYAGALSLGGIAAGANIVDYRHSSTVTAETLNGASITGNSLARIEATSGVVADLDAEAVAAGIGAALRVNTATANLSPEIKARLGNNATLLSNNTAEILARSNVGARASTFGIQASVGAAIGVAYSRVEIGASALAELGNNARIGANTISIRSVIAQPSGRDIADVLSEGASGALIAGVTVNASIAEINTTSNVVLGSGVTLAGRSSSNPARTINLEAKQIAKANAESKAFAGGIFGGAGNEVTVVNAGHQQVSIGANNDIRARDSITILSEADVDLRASGKAGAGGVIAGVGVETSIRSSGTSQVLINNSGLANTGVIHARNGNVNIRAINNISSRGRADAFSAGAGAGAGVALSQFFSDVARVTIGAGQSIEGRSVAIGARNNIRRNLGADGELITRGGGLIGGFAAANNTRFATNAEVNIGNSASIFANDYDGDGLRITAVNDLFADTNTQLESGGAVLIGDVRTNILSTWGSSTLRSAINVGQDVDLTSNAALQLGAFTLSETFANARSTMWGLAGVPDVYASTHITANQSLQIGSGSHLFGIGTIALGAGHTADPWDPFGTKIYAWSDARIWNRTGVPISIIDADTIIHQNNSINIANGAVVESVRDVHLLAAPGRVVTSAYARAISGYEELANAAIDFLASAFGSDVSFESFGGTNAVSDNRLVNVDGLVRAGIWNDIYLTADFDPLLLDEGIIELSVDMSEGIGYTLSEPRSIVSEIQARIDELRARAQEYDNAPDVANALRAQADFLAASLAQSQAKLAGISIPFLVIDPAVSSGGDIFIQADNLWGGGELEARGGGRIEITNNTPYFLELQRLEISDSGGLGRVVFNGVNLDAGLDGLVSNSTINSINQISGANFSRVFAGGQGPAPEISVRNTWVGPPAGVWDGILTPAQAAVLSLDSETFITGDLLNRRGLISVDSTGSINASGRIIGQTVRLTTKGDLVQSYVSGFRHIAGAPEAQLRALYDELAAAVSGTSSTASRTVEQILAAIEAAVAGAPDTLEGLEANLETEQSLNDALTADFEEAHQAFIDASDAWLNTNPSSSNWLELFGDLITASVERNTLEQQLIASNKRLADLERLVSYASAVGGAQIAGNNVFIAAESLNINGLIQSGLADHKLTITEAMVAGVAGYKEAFENGTGERLVRLDSGTGVELDGNDWIGAPAVWYNAAEDRLEIEETEIQGGAMFLSGIILNTGNGELRVLDGYGRITIDNQTDLDMAVYRLDASREVEGLLSITDGARRVYVDADGGRHLVTLSDLFNGNIVDIITDPENFLDTYGITLAEGESLTAPQIFSYLRPLVTEFTRVGADLNVAEYWLAPGETQHQEDLSAILRQAGDAGFAAAGGGTGRSGFFNPLANQVYSVIEGTKTATITEETWYKDSDTFFGADLGKLGEWFADNRGTFLRSNTYETGVIDLDQANTPLFRDMSGNGLEFQYNQIETGSKQLPMVYDNYCIKRESVFGVSWCATRRYTQTEVTESTQDNFFRYYLKADHEIGVEFIGYDTSLVDVTSGGDILINGPVLSAHLTELESRNGSIRMGSFGAQTQTGIVGGPEVRLSAAGSIGSAASPVILGVRTLDDQRGLLSATAGGDIHLYQDRTALGINLVHAGGLIHMESVGGIHGMGDQLHMDGNRFELFSKAGRIGGENANDRLQIRAGADQYSTLTMRASGDIRLDATVRDGGDSLHVRELHSEGGDVYLRTPAIIVDANDERYDDPLGDRLLELWTSFNLLGAGADTRLEASLEAERSSLTADYFWYWQQRNISIENGGYTADDYNPDYEPDSDFAQGLKDANGWDDDQLNLWLDRQKERYASTHERLVLLGLDDLSTFSESFTATLTAEESNALSADYAWTEDQLRFAINSASIKAIGSTLPDVEAPNVIGRNIVLEGAAIGDLRDTISLTLPAPGETLVLTDEIRIALSRAERDDFELVGDTLNIAQLEDFNFELLGGTLIADATDDILLSTEGTALVERVDSSAGDIRLRARNGVFEEEGVSGGAIRGGNLIVEGGDGDIGEEDRFLTIALRDGSRMIARTEGSMYIDEIFGDMEIDFAFAGQNARLFAEGSILDANRDDVDRANFENIQAGYIELLARGGDIGSAPMGNDFSGLLNVVHGSNGFFSAKADESIYVMGQGTSGGPLDFVLGGAGHADNFFGSNALEAGGEIVAVAATGDLLATANLLAHTGIRLLSAGGMETLLGAQVLNATSGDISMIALLGDLTIGDLVRNLAEDAHIELRADSGSVTIAESAEVDSEGTVEMSAGQDLAEPLATDGLLGVLANVRGHQGVNGIGHEVIVGGSSNVTSELGDVVLTSTSRDLEVLGAIGTGDPSLPGMQGGQILLTSAADAFFGADSTVDTEHGSIGIFANQGAITQQDGARLRSLTGAVTLQSLGDILLANVETGNTTDAAVNITSMNGAILDGGDSHIDIIANQEAALTTLFAANGIGVGNPLEVLLWELFATNTTLGEIDIDSLDDLRIRRIDQQAPDEFIRLLVRGDLTVLPGFGGISANGGLIDIRSIEGGSGLFFDEVNSQGGDIDLFIAQNLYFGSAGNVFSEGGNIRLYSGLEVIPGDEHEGTFIQEDGAQAYSGEGWLDVQATGNVILSSLRSDRITDQPFAEPYIDFSLRVMSERGGIEDGGDLLLDLIANPAGGYALTVLRSWKGIGKDIEDGRTLFLDVDLSVLDAETFGPEAGIFLDNFGDLIVKRAVTWDGHVKLGAGGNLDLYLVDVGNNFKRDPWEAHFVSRNGNLAFGTVFGNAAIFGGTPGNIHHLNIRPTILTANTISLLSLNGFIGGTPAGNGYFQGRLNGLGHYYALRGISIENSGPFNIQTATTPANLNLRGLGGGLMADALGAGGNMLIEVPGGNANINRLGVGTGVLPRGNWHTFFLGSSPTSPMTIFTPNNWTAEINRGGSPQDILIGDLAFRGIGTAFADGDIVIERVLQGQQFILAGQRNPMANWIDVNFVHSDSPEFLQLHGHDFLVRTPSESLMVKSGLLGERGDIYLRNEWVGFNTWIPQPVYQGEDLLLFAPVDGKFGFEIDGKTVNTEYILPFYLQLDWTFNGLTRQRGLYHWWLTDLSTYSSRLWIDAIESQMELKQPRTPLESDPEPLIDWEGQVEGEGVPINLSILNP